jgi:hypothetical protein
MSQRRPTADVDERHAQEMRVLGASTFEIVCAASLHGARFSKAGAITRRCAKKVAQTERSSSRAAPDEEFRSAIAGQFAAR